MKIQITGASGFVGQNLVEHLLQNKHEVKKVSLRDTQWEKYLDKNANAIIHLAGKAHDTKNTSSSEEYFLVNRDLSIKLFDAFLDSTTQDFIYFSSVKAVADTVDGVLDENVMPSPKTPYGISKLQAEHYILSKELPVGKRVFIIRPCMIHGPGNKGNLNLLYNVVKKGAPYPLASYNNKRSFLNIDNLNFLTEKILTNKGVASGIYNFADDTPISTNELVSIISEVLGKKPRLLHLPKIIINTIAKAGDLLRFPLNSESLKKLTENYVVSNTKIKKALSVDTLPVSAKDGLIKTIKSFSK